MKWQNSQSDKKNKKIKKYEIKLIFSTINSIEYYRIISIFLQFVSNTLTNNFQISQFSQMAKL